MTQGKKPNPTCRVFSSKMIPRFLNDPDMHSRWRGRLLPLDWRSRAGPLPETFMAQARLMYAKKGKVNQGLNALPTGKLRLAPITLGWPASRHLAHRGVLYERCQLTRSK